MTCPRRLHGAALGVLVSIVLVGCQPTARLAYELEDFETQQDVEIAEVPDAGGGKVVRFAKDTSEVSMTVSLPKGAYRMVAYMEGINPDHDSVWAEVAGHKDFMWVGSYGHIVEAAKDAEFLVPGGPTRIRFLTKETGVSVDRFRLQRVPDEIVRRRLVLEERKDLPFDFEPYVFSGTKFAEGDFRRPREVRERLGDYTLRFRYYDGRLAGVEEAAEPGRYGAVAERHWPDGRVSRRFRTLYRLPEPVDWWGTTLDARVALPAALGGDPAVARSQSAAVVEAVKWNLARSFERDRESAVLLAALSETRPEEPTATAFTNPMARDRVWWVGLKRRLYGHEERFTCDLARPNRPDMDQAPVVRRGTLDEAGLRAEAVRRVDDLCAEWAAYSDQGFAVCLVRNGLIAMHKAYGERDGKPMAVDDPSSMASITKLMAGTLLTMAVDQGLVDPDANVSAYLPPLAGRPTARPLLVRHLYTHTSGLWGHWGSEEHVLEEQVADLAPWLPVGYKYDYNGTGLELGGKILEAVTGRALPQLYREHLLDPLGMAHTEVTDSGGGARSTPLDMARLGQMLLNRGAYGDMRFFGEAAFAEFLPHRLVKEIGPETETVYGFGTSWFDAEGLGEGTFGHGAASSAIFRVSPAHRLVVVMCRNSAGENYAKYVGRLMGRVAAAVGEE